MTTNSITKPSSCDLVCLPKQLCVFSAITVVVLGIITLSCFLKGGSSAFHSHNLIGTIGVASLYCMGTIGITTLVISIIFCISNRMEKNQTQSDLWAQLSSLDCINFDHAEIKEDIHPNRVARALYLHCKNGAVIEISNLEKGEWSSQSAGDGEHYVYRNSLGLFYFYHMGSTDYSEVQLLLQQLASI